jgi:hypothetical protein
MQRCFADDPPSDDWMFDGCVGFVARACFAKSGKTSRAPQALLVDWHQFTQRDRVTQCEEEVAMEIPGVAAGLSTHECGGVA